MATSWNIDPVKKDYINTAGNPAETDSLQVPAYIRMKVPRGRWMYAPDATYGSTLSEIKKRQSTQDPTALENIAAAALQPIADDGRASTIDVSVIQVARSGIGLQVNITDARGASDTFVLPGLGV